MNNEHMQMNGSAIAVFVKTAGVSPVKTRLAASIGQEKAENFYSLSVKAIEATLKKLSAKDSNVVPYWAVAEKEALEVSRWSGFRRIFQRDGTLGHRLFSVYSELLKKHSTVLLIGADS